MSVYKSSTGMDENIASVLCYLFSFVGGLVFLLIEKRSRYVLFHAVQSVFVFVALMVAHVLAGFVPLIGPALAALLTLAGIILWVVMVVSAAQGKWFKIPWIGDLAFQQSRHL